jgi:hypothetical protein
MDTGASTSANTIPDLDSSFPVDLALIKNLTQSQDWHIGTRLQGTKKLNTNLSASESTSSNQVWDSNLGCWKNLGSEYQGWMWKRHAGFDVTAFSHNVSQGDHSIFHSLGKTPEMWWLKKRDQVISWYVWHKGLNGGTNTQDYYISLNSNGAEESQTGIWGSGPTSTHMTLPDSTFGTGDYVMMFFASANDINGNPISKVGSYTGNGTSGLGITVGFQPRFVIIKNISSNYSWLTFDTTRGWGSGNDKLLKLNSDAAEYTSTDYGAPTSNGFTVGSSASINQNNDNFIYYAHA